MTVISISHKNKVHSLFHPVLHKFELESDVNRRQIFNTEYHQGTALLVRNSEVGVKL